MQKGQKKNRGPREEESVVRFWCQPYTYNESRLYIKGSVRVLESGKEKNPHWKKKKEESKIKERPIKMAKIILV